MSDISSMTTSLQRTCRPMVSVIGTKQPPSLGTMRNTENLSHLQGQSGASAKKRTVIRRSVTTLETKRNASCQPIRTSLITTVSTARKFYFALRKKNFKKTQALNRIGDHGHCHSKDINMFCSEETMLDPRDNIAKNLCRCRKDMQFDTK